MLKLGVIDGDNNEITPCLRGARVVRCGCGCGVVGGKRLGAAVRFWGLGLFMFSYSVDVQVQVRVLLLLLGYRRESRKRQLVTPDAQEPKRGAPSH